LSNETVRNDVKVMYEQGWVFRYLPARLKPGRLLVMLHGWTGNENSMNVFQRDIPRDYAILSPRGPIESDEGGYGWVTPRSSKLSPLDSFQASVQRLHAALDTWAGEFDLLRTPLSMAGFSQGAALTLAYTLAYPQEVDKAVCMSGFLPDPGADFIAPEEVRSVRILITHGSDDDTVPVERARSAAQFLESAGADVQYCEGNGGHRLSAGCFRELTRFLNEK
jgi:phospholipase/carboxylesterase